MVRLTDRPDMTLDVYRGRKTTMQHHRYTAQATYTTVLSSLIYIEQTAQHHGKRVLVHLPTTCV